MKTVSHITYTVLATWRGHKTLLNPIHKILFSVAFLVPFGLSSQIMDSGWTDLLGTGICFSFLADRTNGRAIATLLRLSSSSICLSVTLCIVAKRCVLEQKLLLRAYRKSYMRNRLVPK